MFHPNLHRPPTRRVRMLVFTSFLLVVGLALIVLPSALTVLASGVGIDQCANGVAGTNPMICSWTTGIVGNANSSYIEGMANPQRFLLNDLYGGSTTCDISTHTCNLTFSASWTDGTNHGYDMLVSWDQAVTVNKQLAGVSDFLMNPCTGYNPGDTAICTSVYTTNQHIYNVSFPDDPFVSGSYQVDGSAQMRINAFESLYGDRQLRIYSDAPITSAVMSLTHCTNNLSSCGLANGTDTSGQTVISYTLSFSTNASNALVTFGGHFAFSGNPRVNPLSWGYTNGAGAIGGASWHIKDPKFNYTGGSQDNAAQLSHASAYPIDSSTTGTFKSGVGWGITDTAYITNTYPGATDIVGNIHFYVCADTTDPYKPAASSALQFGCPTTTDGPGYTVTDLGTKTMTVVNSGGSKNSTVTSAVFTPTLAGRYCFLTVFTPTDAIPYDYNVMSDTNGVGECMVVDNPTAVQLSTFNASNDQNWTMIGLVLGLLGMVASIGIVKLSVSHH